MAMEHTVKTILRWAVFVLAVAATTAWIVLSFTYLNRLGWDGILSLEPGVLAATLAAVSAPPAALWLVLVVVAQQQELALLRHMVSDQGSVLRRGQEQAESNSRALLELTALAGRSSAKDTLPLVLDDLASHAAAVAERLGVLEADSLDLAWARYGAGDRWALLKPFLERAAIEDDFAERLAKALQQDHGAQASAAAFTRRLQSLRSQSHGIGEQKLLVEVLEDGPAAQVDRLFSPDQASVALVKEDDTETGSEADEISDRLGPQPTLFPSGSRPN